MVSGDGAVSKRLIALRGTGVGCVADDPDDDELDEPEVLCRLDEFPELLPEPGPFEPAFPDEEPPEPDDEPEAKTVVGVVDARLSFEEGVSVVGMPLEPDDVRPDVLCAEELEADVELWM
jgi:hypothetical protein